MDGEPRIISDPPLIVPIDELVARGRCDRTQRGHPALIRSYRRSLPSDRRQLLERFRYVDLARKVVGVGSVGTRAWIVLMLGRDGDDPLFLQAKEAQASVLEPYLGKSAYNNHGQRVVEGQRLMQSESDILLGWLRARASTGSIATSTSASCGTRRARPSSRSWSRPSMTVYARLCGWTLAKAHARSGDPIAIAAYMGTSDTFDRAMAVFAEKYADQNERDYAALQEAVRLRPGHRAEPGSDARPALPRSAGRQSSENDTVLISSRTMIATMVAKIAATQMLVIPSVPTTLSSSQPATKAATRPMARLGIQPRMSRPPAMIPEMTPASSPTTIQPTNVKSIGGVWQRPMAPARLSRRNRCASATR